MFPKSILFTTISLFLIAIIAISLAFFSLYTVQEKSDTRLIKERYSVVAQATLWQMKINPDPATLKKGWQQFDFEWITNAKLFQLVTQQKKNVWAEKYTSGRAVVYRYAGRVYLYLESEGIGLLLYDKRYVLNSFEFLLLFYILTVLVLSIILAVIIKKLQPLNLLKRRLRSFADGDMQSRFEVLHQGEIGAVEESFNYAADRIRGLIESRMLFMRNIMHELKTPITKGMIATHMLESQKDQDRLSSVFERLDHLLHEFSAIERVVSGEKQMDTEEIYISEVLDLALEYLMIKDEEIMIDLEDSKIYADKELLATALKNLIDNGLKYGSDHRVKITITKYIISVQSSGDKLEHALDYYTQSFVKYHSTGLGLGLYIVDNVVKLHGFRFDYMFDQGRNKFIITIA
jgi:two-component system OmpR family sensor kinase